MVVATFGDFVSAVAKYRGECPKDWRTGQAAFNLLSRVRPEIAFLVQGSEFDPFQDDARLSDFYDFVMRHWGSNDEPWLL